MASSYEEIVAKAKEIHAGGDREGAAKLLKIAEARKPGMTNGEKIPAAINKFTTGFFLGAGDEINAAGDALVGRGDGETFKDRYSDRLNDYRDQEARLEEDSPGLAAGAEIAGVIAPALLSRGSLAPATAAKLAGPNVKKQVLSKLLPYMKAGGLGSVGGGIYGFNSGEGNIESRAQNAVEDAIISGAAATTIPVVGGAVQRIANSRAGKAAIKDALSKAENFKGQASDIYNNITATISPNAMRETVGEIDDKLFGDVRGFIDPKKVSNEATKVLDLARDTAESGLPVPYKAAQWLRRQAGDVAGSPDKSIRRMGMEIKGGIDDLIQKSAPEAADANSLWQKAYKMDLLDEAVEKGKDALSGEASGIRNAFKSLLRNKSTKDTFSDAEKEAMRKVINGTPAERAIVLAGGGLSRILTALGMGSQGLAGGAAGLVVGQGLSNTADRIVAKNADTAKAIIASGALSKIPVASTATRDKLMKVLYPTAYVAPNQ